MSTVYVWPDPPSGMGRTARCVLKAIRELYAESNGLPPTVREIQAHTEISSPSVVQYHLCKLDKAGLVTHQPGKARTLVPVLEMQVGEPPEFPSYVGFDGREHAEF